MNARDAAPLLASVGAAEPAPADIPARARLILRPWAPAAFLLGAALIAYAPTYLKLIAGPWRTEQEGHGPLVILAVAWMCWRRRAFFAATPNAPAAAAGWGCLLFGLAAMIIGRSQDIMLVEVGSQIPVLAGCVLLAGGGASLRVAAFPIAFMAFTVPPPAWLMDAFTVPLKGMVSDWVAQTLYWLGYPIAQNGVMIMIGAAELMVKDACAGMNSIFALSAIGVFYVNAFVGGSRLRAIALIAAILPITIAANFLRVTSLVLIAYYFGADAVDGIYHDLAGFFLFALALALFVGLDAILVALGGNLSAPARRDAARGGAQKSLRIDPTTLHWIARSLLVAAARS